MASGRRFNPLGFNRLGKPILGQRCYASLADIEQPVDMVDVFRSSEAALGVTEEAIAIGAKVVWMQLQIVNPQAAQMAESAGIKVVMDRCPKLELQKPYWTGVAN